jgi:hypothetical protein
MVTSSGQLPAKCLDLPGGVVKDQPHSAVGTPVANATTGLERLLSN